MYNYMMVILFVYFALFLHNFVIFFEDLFLIIAFMIFLITIFQLISTSTKSYFAARADHIRMLYAKLFTRRKEAIEKNKLLVQQLYLKQPADLVAQYAALFYLKHAFNVKLYKEIEIAIQNTSAQLVFIEIQQQLTKELRAQIQTPVKK
jgi:membrane-associated phospholipid phosphatase